MNKSGNVDLLLINPAYERLKGFAFASLPNGILGLATHLNNHGYSTLVYDVDTNVGEGHKLYTAENRSEEHNLYAEALDNNDHRVWKEVRDTIRTQDPTYVGVSVLSPAIHSALKVIEIAREFGKPVLVGGPHVNIVREKAFNLKDYDYIFFGEAEQSLLEFMQAQGDIEKIKTIKGIGFNHNGERIYNGFGDRIKNLDEFPFPRREYLLYKDRYGVEDLAIIMASRGCPFNCNFCASVPIWGRSVVFRSPDHVIQEIRYLRKNYGIGEFKFYDDTFTIKKKNLVEFCEKMIETFHEHPISWRCLSHVTSLCKDTLALMKKAGCNQVMIGVESGSQKIIDLIDKRMQLTAIEEAIKHAKKLGMWVHNFYLTGLPYETREDMQATLDFLKKTKPDSVNCCTFTPHPGTGLWDYCVQNKLIADENDYEMYKYLGHHSSYNFFSQTMSREEFNHMRSKIFRYVGKLNSNMNLRKIIYRLRTLSPGRVKRRLLIYWHMCTSVFHRTKRNQKQSLKPVYNN